MESEVKKTKKVPEYVKRARQFLAEIQDGTRIQKPSDDQKIAEAKLILAVYGCQLEGVPVTVANLIIVLGPDATETLKYLTPEQYPQYGIIDAKI